MTNHIEGNSTETSVKEAEPRYGLRYIVTMSGEAGTGKSSTANALSIMYGLPTAHVIKIGEVFRQLAFQTTGKGMEGFFERSPEIDTSIDAMQVSLLEGLTPKIIDSRLGAWLAQQVRQSRSNMLPIVSILLVGQEDMLGQRVHHRDRKTNPSLTLEQSINQAAERRRRDLEQWRKVHPNLPTNYPQGLEEPPLTIDTTWLDKETAIASVHELLLKMGALEKLPSQGSLPFKPR